MAFRELCCCRAPQKKGNLWRIRWNREVCEECESGGVRNFCADGCMESGEWPSRMTFVWAPDHPSSTPDSPSSCVSASRPTLGAPTGKRGHLSCPQVTISRSRMAQNLGDHSLGSLCRLPAALSPLLDLPSTHDSFPKRAPLLNSSGSIILTQSTVQAWHGLQRAIVWCLPGSCL